MATLTELNKEHSDLTPKQIKNREAFAERESEAKRKISLEELREILSSTIKHDDSTKTLTFLSLLLNYTSQEQKNLVFSAESSSGKSYLALETLQYFDDSDKIILGFASKKSFYHDAGKIEVDEDGNETVIVDLEKKFVVFLDQSSDEVLKMLRPLMSHDRKQIELKITDKKGNKFKSKRVILKGFPTMILCTASQIKENQEKTRSLILSPSTDQAKLTASIQERLLKECNREAYDKRLKSDTRRRRLMMRVADIKTANIENIIIGEALRQKIEKEFLAKRQVRKPRHSRDISRLVGIIKSLALFNLYQRERSDDQRTIYASKQDVETGLQLYEEIAESNELGLSPEFYRLYAELRPYVDEFGILKDEIYALYYGLYHRPFSNRRIKDFILALESAGLAYTEQNQLGDKRKIRFFLVENKKQIGQETLTNE